jgi:TonB family protein
MKPVEIVFKPSPAYTEEARQAHVQGEVLLSVVFKASGEIHVVRVVSGLGHGLDESAVRAAQQIRFKPAERAGQPVDFPATLHCFSAIGVRPIQGIGGESMKASLDGT